jgi:rhamnosyltransferase
MVDQICAIIVTYHPDEELKERIAALRPQVGRLVLVDNKSSESELIRLRDLSRFYAFTLLENSENLGIGSALNRGIRWAKQASFRFVALFDQDSEVTEGFIEALVACIERHPSSEKIAVAAPRLFARDTGTIDAPFGHRAERKVAQTSGSLMPLRVFDSQGWFNEDLFIDYVDYEYCLRVTAAGWIVLRCDEAVLRHAPGNSRRHYFLGLYAGTTANYSPYRHYYSTRNAVWVITEYWKTHPAWCAGEAFRVLKEKIKLCVWERNRRTKVALSLRGLEDGLNGKLGKRDFFQPQDTYSSK